MSLVSFLILRCLKPHCDSLSCELSNLILRLLMLKYIIISDVSEDFTVLIMALNQIGNPLLITQAVLGFSERFWAAEKFRSAQEGALWSPGRSTELPRPARGVGAAGPRARQLLRVCFCSALAGLCSL